MISRLLSALILFVFSQSAIGNSLETKIDQIMSPYNSLQRPGAAVAVFKDGQILFNKGYGLARIDGRTDIGPDSNFRLASVSKQFTAQAILLLIQRHQLTLKTTLGELFPNFPRYGKKITIYQLLNHTSGLRKYEKNIPTNQNGQLSDQDVFNIMTSLRSGLFAPGTRYKYSNSGYAILAVIVEKISGLNYSDFVKRNFFEPLQMADTLAFQKSRHRVRHRVFGHNLINGRFKVSDQNIFSAVLGDGGIYSSVSELFFWDQALNESSIIQKKLMDQAMNKTRLKNGSKINYGFGWRVGSHRGFRTVHHSGSSIGFKNFYLKIPGKKLTVVILSNRHSPSVNAKAFQIANLVW